MTTINPYGLRNEIPGPKLFLYTRNFDWAGCIVVIASSREEASRIVDENPGEQDNGWKKLTMVDGPDKDANGNWIQVEYRGEVPPEEWDELPLAAGTIFRCDGDS